MMWVTIAWLVGWAMPSALILQGHGSFLEGMLMGSPVGFGKSAISIVMGWF